MEEIKRLYQHLDWANWRMLEHLKRTGVDDEDIKRLLAHILAAEQIWLARLKGMDSSHIALWSSDADLEHYSELLQQNQASYEAYLNSLAEEDLDVMIDYRNLSGVECRTPVRDILIHVALHGQYHRGQINTRLRLAGLEPLGMDYIAFVRES